MKIKWIGLILLCASFVLFLIFKPSKKDIPYRTAIVVRGDIQVTVTATGALSARATVQVGTQVSGTVSKLYVDFNSHVKKGQAIALLDTTLLHAAIEEARSNFKKNEAQTFLAHTSRERKQVLFDENMCSKAELDQVVADDIIAQANLQQARVQLNRAVANLNYATIVSPIEGVVIDRKVDVGQTVAASFSTPTLFTIADDLTKMQVQAAIDEADIGMLETGQQVSFTVDAYPDKTFNGFVSQIRLQPTMTQNIVTYTTIIDVDNPDYRLMPGMTANLTIIVQSRKNVLIVPLAALSFKPPFPPENPPGKMPLTPGIRNKGGLKESEKGNGRQFFPNSSDKVPAPSISMVYILENEHPKPVKVQTGIRNNSLVEVQGDLMKIYSL